MVLLLLAAPLLRAEDPLEEGRKAEGEAKLLLVRVEGVIDDGVVDSIEREVRSWLAEEPRIGFIVFQLDTPGGFGEASHRLSHFIFHDLKGYRTIAFIPPGKQALSAGALIAVSAKEIVMGANSHMGAAEPLIAKPGFEGFEAAGEKAQSVIRGWFKGYAIDRGYPTTLTDAMVTKDHEDIYKARFARGNADEEDVRFLTRGDLDNLTPADRLARRGEPQLILRKGLLLVMNDREAREYRFVKHLADDLTELRAEVGIPVSNENVIDAARGALKSHYPQGQALVDFFNRPVPRFLLLLCGSLAFLLEVKMLGTFIPGTFAVLCFVVFFATSLLPVSGSIEATATFFDVVLFALGVGLLAVEFFLLPGLAIFALAGLALCAVSLVTAMIPQEPGTSGFGVEDAVTVLALGFGAGTCCFLFLLRFLPTNPAFARKGLVSQSSIVGVPTADSALQAQTEALAILGKTGRALTSLHPAGKVETEDGRLLDVVAEGEFIEQGTPVKVIQCEGGRIVVERAASSPAPPPGGVEERGGGEGHGDG
jgi:membrane-bound serine protease (ClpP class)